MKCLLVHDDSMMSKLLIGHLGDERMSVCPVDAETVGLSEFAGLCTNADAVLYVSTGWDDIAAERDDDWLEVLVKALQGTAKRLLYVSEATVIGDTGESFGNEDSPASPDAPHPWRATAERRLLDAVASGVHSVIVRPALVHGWGAGKLVHRLLVHAESSGESWYVGDGEARMSTVHINDVISLIGAALVRAPEGTTYVAASDEVVTWREVAEAVAATTRGPCALRSVTAAQAAEVDLDAATMAMTTVVQDHSARRRLGWTAAGPELVTDL